MCEKRGKCTDEISIFRKNPPLPNIYKVRYITRITRCAIMARCDIARIKSVAHTFGTGGRSCASQTVYCWRALAGGCGGVLWEGFSASWGMVRGRLCFWVSENGGVCVWDFGGNGEVFFDIFFICKYAFGMYKYWCEFIVRVYKFYFIQNK